MTTDVKYGKWTVGLNYSFAPAWAAFTAVHDDYDGAPIHSESNDCPDHRAFQGPSVEDVLEQVKQYNLNEGIGCADCGNEWDDLVPEIGGRYELCVPCSDQRTQDRLSGGE